MFLVMVRPSSCIRLFVDCVFNDDTAALAVDMTARNLQDQVRKKGLPWSAAKGFDGFTPIGYASRLSILLVLRTDSETQQEIHTKVRNQRPLRSTTLPFCAYTIARAHKLTSD